MQKEEQIDGMVHVPGHGYMPAPTPKFCEHGQRTGDCHTCDDIIARLLEACKGHPFAKIAWPHRLLHDAIKEIARLREVASRPPMLVCHGRVDDTAAPKKRIIKATLDGETMTCEPAARAAVRKLRSEIDCRIDHGADGGGHLLYVRKELDEILRGMDDQ